MKNFKQYLEETGSVGVWNQTPVDVDGYDTFDITNPSVLKRVNAFVGSIAAQEYLNPKAAVEQLANKLKTIGLEVSMPAMEGANGSVTGEVSQFGGRFGKDVDGSDLNDDGISHRKEGGLKLNVKYETLDNGSSKVFAKLV